MLLLLLLLLCIWKKGAGVVNVMVTVAAAMAAVTLDAAGIVHCTPTHAHTHIGVCAGVCIGATTSTRGVKGEVAGCIKEIRDVSDQAHAKRFRVGPPLVPWILVVAQRGHVETPRQDLPLSVAVKKTGKAMLPAPSNS